MPAFRRLLHWSWLVVPVLASCVSTSSVVVGESPLPPPTNIPVVPVAAVDDAGLPVPAAMMIVGDQVVAADASGVALVEWRGQPMNVSIEAPGFFPGAIAVPEFSDEPVSLELRPVVLHGSVTDSAGRALTGATVQLGTQEVVTNDDGHFQISRATPGDLTISRPGWHDAAVSWDGASLAATVALEPRIIRGLHVAGLTAGNDAEWQNLLTIAEETVVNSLIIDLKDESGRVFYDTNVELAHEVGAVDPAFDLAEAIRDMRERDLYIIARIVSFQDPIAARRYEAIAVWDTSTEAPYQNRGQYFLDPTDPIARRYALDLAVEACAAGIDEIQFDYVRYPDGFPASARFDGGADAETRPVTISTFLNEAGDALHPMGCSVAADIFGFITSVANDGGIGQQFEMLSGATDVLSPMIYPSHYSSGWFGFASPNDNPGPVIAGALDDGLPRLQGAAIVRPWLQDFFYNSSQVRAQIEEAEARSVGWMLWNAASNFQVGALDRDQDASPELEPETPAPAGTTPQVADETPPDDTAVIQPEDDAEASGWGRPSL